MYTPILGSAVDLKIKNKECVQFIGQHKHTLRKEKQILEPQGGVVMPKKTRHVGAVVVTQELLTNSFKSRLAQPETGKSQFPSDIFLV